MANKITHIPVTSHDDLMNAARTIVLVLPSVETRGLRKLMQHGGSDALRAELRCIELRHGDRVPSEAWRTLQTA